jgi:hypothetical protein
MMVVMLMIRVGQNHLYTVCVRCTVFLAGDSPYIRSYTHIRCIYTVLANPTYDAVHRARSEHETNTLNPKGIHTKHKMCSSVCECVKLLL